MPDVARGPAMIEGWGISEGQINNVYQVKLIGWGGLVEGKNVATWSVKEVVSIFLVFAERGIGYAKKKLMRRLKDCK